MTPRETFAGSATALPPLERGIGFVKGVATLAMCLPRLFSRGAFSSQDVHPKSNWFQMGRSYTKADTTEMVKCQPRWNRTNQKFIGEPMYVYQSAGAFSPCSFVSNPTISPASLAACPDPTRAEIGAMGRQRAIFINSSPETFRESAAQWGVSHQRIAVELPALVVSATKASRPQRFRAQATCTTRSSRLRLHRRTFLSRCRGAGRFQRRRSLYSTIGERA